jgi:DNA-binding LacI/PurR family transcriptional regulator
MKPKTPAPTATKHPLIANDLRKQIRQGRLRDRVPGQRVLSKTYGVNFLTVRKAMATLVEEGLISRHPGKGTFVTRLRRERTRNLAAVLGGLAHGFGGQHSALIHGIQEEAGKYQHDLILRPHHGDSRLEQQALEDLIKRGKVDGMLIWPTRRESSRAIEILQKHKVPFVVVMRIDPPVQDDVSYVVDDDLRGGFLATQHLLALGHRRIGYVSRTATRGLGDAYEELRWEGFLRAHEEAGLAPGPRIEADWLGKGEEGAKPFSRKFLNAIEGLTALCCMNDRTALRLLHLAKLTPREIPRDLSIVGYDDMEAAELFNLTTVHQPMKEIGAEAVRLLLADIEGRRSGAIQRRLPPRLVVRGSTSAPSGR